jgi:hypothetical protein
VSVSVYVCVYSIVGYLDWFCKTNSLNIKLITNQYNLVYIRPPPMFTSGKDPIISFGLFQHLSGRNEKVYITANLTVFMMHKAESQFEPCEVWRFKANLYLTFCVSTFL